MYQITALNQTVSIVEPTGSWLDPQLGFLYLVLTAALFGGAYAIYNPFIESQTKGKKPTGTKRVKAVTVPTEKKSYPVVKPYEEEWIPEQHLKNRASKLKKRESGVSGGEDLTTSGGEATSGPDSAPEGRSPRKGKGKKA